MAQRRLKQNFNEVQAILDAVGQKVDKIEGKGLSANDYTDQDKDKLASVEEDAQENVIEAIESDGVELPIENKTVRIPAHKQSDWSQNDSSGKDYIKNRTHWEENGVVHKLHPKFLDMDASPTSGSTKPVTSGGVKEALDGKQDVISDLADIRQGAGLGETAYQKPSAGIPASDLATGVIPDVSGFITRTVNDLANYYLKSETYTKEEVAALIGAIKQFHYEVYATRPQTGEGNVLYLIGPTGSGSDKYEEYVYANNGWVKIGDTSIDLSGYVTIEALNQALSGYVTSAALATALTGKVGSETIHNIVELTQAEYDALQTKRDDTMYIITDTEIPSSEVGIAGFEQTTESSEDGGTNIWTVTLTNGQSFQLAVKNGSKGSTGATGPQGIQGIQGPQGNTGSSVDYPYELVNNLTTDDATKGLSAAQGVVLKNDVETLKEQVGEGSYVIDSPDGFPYKRRHQVSKSAESATGNRYTLGLNIIKGTAIKVRSTYALGICVIGYDTFDHGCIGSTTGRLQIYSDYSTDEIVGVANVDQVLTVKWKNSDESAITDAQIEQMLASLTVEVTFPSNGLVGDVETLKEQVQEIINNPTDSSSVESDKKLLYIGPLVQKAVSGNTFTDSSVTVTQRCALAVPYYNAIVGIKLPAGYSVGFKTGYSTTGASLTWGVDSGLLSNGDNYTFDGHNGQVYRVYFKKSNGADITVEEVSGLIASGGIQLTYLSPDGSIVTRNSHTESYVKGLMRKFTGTLANDDSLHKMPVLTHLSDIHGDAVRYENFVQYSDSIEADAAIVSGDMVPMCGSEDGTEYIDDIMDKYKVMTLPVMGNHDARKRTTKTLQNAVLAHSISKYLLQTPSEESSPTYYYKDITTQSIRIIALNLYCAGQKDTNTWRITQEQITWFIATLASTPENYGVVVVMHSPETITVKDNDHSKFYQSNGYGDVAYRNPWMPFRKIVDAFISKTTLVGTFDETITGDVVETITVNADFTSIASGVEFICYLTGHRHKDAIGYVDGATNLQLMCNIALGFSLYGDSNYHYYAEQSDLPRGGKGLVQDSFNVYIIDRATGNLRVARIGSNMNQDFEMRDWMIIPYK